MLPFSCDVGMIWITIGLIGKKKGFIWNAKPDFIIFDQWSQTNEIKNSILFSNEISCFLSTSIFFKKSLTKFGPAFMPGLK